MRRSPRPGRRKHRRFRHGPPAELDPLLTECQHCVDLGLDGVYVHNVGRNQGPFIRAYGERVIPKLR